jgi:predicted acyltransferase
MLGHLRSARPVRATLVLAAALGVGGSLGLHAEPGPARAGLTRTSTAVATSAAKEVPPGAHTCLLCLLWGSVLSSGGLSVAPGTLLRVPGTVTGRSMPEMALLTPDRGGRAPPALL